jgi:hypothetical protein
VCLLDFGIDVMYNLAALIFLKAPGKNEKDLPSESMVSALSYLCHFFLSNSLVNNGIFLLMGDRFYCFCTSTSCFV